MQISRKISESLKEEANAVSPLQTLRDQGSFRKEKACAGNIFSSIAEEIEVSRAL